MTVDQPRPDAQKKTLSRRLSHFLARPPASRRYAMRNGLQRALSRLVQRRATGLGGLFAVCLPDAFWLKGEHSEFAALHQRFTRHNSANNGADGVRLWAFMMNIKQVLHDGVAGDFAELGVWRGNTAAVLAHYAAFHHREVFLFDTFAGFASQDMVAVDADKPMAFADTSVALAREVIGTEMNHCHYIQGYFPDSVTNEAAARQYAVVSLDCDLYEPMRAGLEFFYARMPQGGLFLLHDYSSTHWDGAAKAINEFCAARHEHLTLLPDKSGSALLRKSRSTVG